MRPDEIGLLVQVMASRAVFSQFLSTLDQGFAFGTRARRSSSQCLKRITSYCIDANQGSYAEYQPKILLSHYKKQGMRVGGVDHSTSEPASIITPT